jgi:hypothetical protein
MLSNFDLEDLSEHYGFALNSAKMNDEMKAIPAKSGNCIINLQSSSQGNGTHWVCIAIRGKLSFYQDSFGVLMPQEVITFCKRILKSRLGYNDFGFQDIKGETCGWYSVGLLIHLHNRRNMDLYDACGDYISLFSYDTKKIIPY